MAGHGDLQEMLRMLTARKASMMAAMGYIKALQAKNLKRRESGAADALVTTGSQAAISDAKLAKSFHTACKSHGKKSNKRAAEEPAAAERKKPRLEMHKRDLDYNSMPPEELEASLALPLCEDEELIRETTLVTNRAPLVLAFAVELLRFTMPEQPPSSRLSLAQAVVSANSKSKAISIGIEKAPAGEETPIPTGQPKVSVLGREIPVLKRGGYTWSDENQQSSTSAEAANSSSSTPASTTPNSVWATSKTLSSKGSIFVAHAASITAPSMRSGLMKLLFNQYPELEKTADHVAWAVRTSFGGSSLVQEASFDDGEAGCGKFMLELLRESNITNTIVVLARWYGGVMLGPDRWRLMRECLNDALSAQKRTSTFSGEALWGLDAEDKKPSMSTIGMAIHRPEGARNYLLKSFASAGASDGGGGKKSAAALNDEKQENLGRLLGALRLLFASWAGVLGRAELDRRAWSWYVAVRPDIEAGPSGWGEKGTLKLSRILDLRRKEGVVTK
ncbi:hypothetical protein A9Z42_0056560 [Trichoderma parareesei]|uniref:Impact N-terminal domain-containing protein n=1 Tax=Trichoderma parareesei TaxID=858221 RepID=A0A2H2ZSL5_TRIPA|nr:hypothetical protein A9Z42_0056560 [Trichoderma parareesei]